MSIFALTDELVFPPVEWAEPDGLLAVGGDLSLARLELAYRSGIFPWFEDKIPMWWSPDPRFVLYPNELKVSRSMHTLIKKNTFEFSVNLDFPGVIKACKTVYREGQLGTWITPDVEKAYIDFHKAGFAHSAEVWQDGELVGGLYGIRMGKVFFGESMFNKRSNASKYAFIKYMEVLKQEGLRMIDCQVYTSHLESLGAKMIPRSRFMGDLKSLID